MDGSIIVLCFDYFSIGSENNSFYVYHKFVSQPILKYKFSAPHTILVSKTRVFHVHMQSPLLNSISFVYFSLGLKNKDMMKVTTSFPQYALEK